MRYLHSIALLLALLTTVRSATGETRIEFRAMKDGQRVEGSEVCFFPADRNDGFFAKFFSTNDVRCMSADAVLDLPPGLFNIFVRSGSTLVSSHPAFADNENPGPPGYDVLDIPLMPAATLDVARAKRGLREGEWLAVYLSNEGQAESPASVRPVPDDETTVLVPADMPLVPLVVREGVIVRAGVPLSLRPRETRVLEPIDKWGSGRDVVALLRAEPVMSPDLPEQPPRVRLQRDGSDPLEPVLAPRGAGLFERSLAIFKDVPGGTYELRLSGDGWRTDAVPVTTSTRLTVADRPLVARIAASVEVRVSLGELARARLATRCPGQHDSASTDDPPRVPAPLVRLLRCTDTPGEDKERCKVVKVERFSGDQSELVVRWSDLEPGRYAAELWYLHLRARTPEWVGRPGRNEPQHLSLRAETVTGRVTHGGTSVQALVSFDHSVAPALSDATGNYAAFVTGGPRRSVVSVTMCDGGEYRYLPPEPVDKSLDIDVPRNEVVVRVVDEHGQPVPGARVEGGPLFPEGDAEYAFLSFPATDATGETRLANLSADGELRLCAYHPPDHERGCAIDFRVGRRETRTITIEVRSRANVKGHLRSTVPFVATVISLVSANGVVVSSSSVSSDGAFDLRRAGPGEYFVIVSRSHPLALFEPPVNPEQAPHFDMPLMGRTFSAVVPASSRKRRLALEGAGHLIPPSVLWQHLAVRGLDEIGEPGEVVEFRDIALPDVIVVYSVPHITDYPPEWAGLDPLEHPHLRIALPRKEVTGRIVHLE